jgi:hypothetical protein
MSRIATREPAVVRVTAPLSRSDLLWVGNTAHGPGGHWHARPHDGDPDHDHLRDPGDARRYLADHRVPVPDGPPDAATLTHLSTIRAVLQRRASGDRDPWTASAQALLTAATFVLAAEGAIRTTQPGWAGFVGNLLPPLVALLADDAALHRCANPACRLLFEDGSRNHARRWCDSGGCGNRDRVRRSLAARHGTTGRSAEPRPA